MRLNEAEEQFQGTLNRLKPREILVSYECLTPRHQLDFDGIGPVGNPADGSCSSEAE